MINPVPASWCDCRWFKCFGSCRLCFQGCSTVSRCGTRPSAFAYHSEREHWCLASTSSSLRQDGLGSTNKAGASVGDNDRIVEGARHCKTEMKTGVAENSTLTSVPGHVKTRLLFVSRLEPYTSEDNVVRLVTSVLGDETVTCTKLWPKHPSYSSFLLSVAEDVFECTNTFEIWPEGSVFKQFFGRLLPSVRFGHTGEDPSWGVDDE